MMKTYISFGIVCTLLLTLPSCYRVPDKIDPKVECFVQDRYLQNLPSPFPPLSDEEKKEDFGKEYLIGIHFAKDLELYQAITAFKRALYLVPTEYKSRKLEIEYEILLCYYVGKKFEEAIYTYEHSNLRFIDTSFPACEDMLIIMYECYSQEKQENNAGRFFQYLETLYPETAEKLKLSREMECGDLKALNRLSPENPNYPIVEKLLEGYNKQKKSITKAQVLNTVLPGAGYLYLGQKQTALTAALVNGLFIGASYYFFQSGNIPAGAIFTGFEAGWYFGGIYGVGQEAKFYNERIYEAHATGLMNQNKLFPLFMIRHAF